MGFFRELDQQPVKELMQRFGRDSCKHGVPAEESQFWYEELACAIAKTGEDGSSFLLDQIPQADESRLLAILLGLTCSPRSSKQAYRQRINEALLGLISSTVCPA